MISVLMHTPLSPAVLAAALERLQLRPATVETVQAATNGQAQGEVKGSGQAAGFGKTRIEQINHRLKLLLLEQMRGELC